MTREQTRQARRAQKGVERNRLAMLYEDHALSIREVSRRTGRSRQAVVRVLRTMDIPIREDRHASPWQMSPQEHRQILDLFARRLSFSAIARTVCRSRESVVDFLRRQKLVHRRHGEWRRISSTRLEESAPCYDCGTTATGFAIDGRWHCRACMLAGAVSGGALECLLFPAEMAEACRLSQVVTRFERHGRSVGTARIRSVG